MTARIEDHRRRAALRYWATLVAWYSVAAALAGLNGRFAAAPWWIGLILFGGLELVTFLAAMYEDDWANDFRGDREIFVRGTLANGLVVALFTFVGLTLR